MRGGEGRGEGRGRREEGNKGKRKKERTYQMILFWGIDRLRNRVYIEPLLRS